MIGSYKTGLFNMKVTYFKELSSVLICIINADCATMDTNVEANSEVLGHKWA
jgi:hypothetical protein